MKVINIYGFKPLNWINAGGITLYPFVLYADKEPTIDIKFHEGIHVLQVKECGWIRFYLSYVLFYLSARVRGDSHWSAYYSVPWEAEAYAKTKAFMSQGKT